MTMTAHQAGGPAAAFARAQTLRPKAIGFALRSVDGPRHRQEIERHARRLGFHYLSTVAPPSGHADPVGYALDIAMGVHAAAIIVYDLGVVGHSPARVCERFELATVCPEQTWAHAVPAMPDPAAHGFPRYRLEVTEAHRIFQRHKQCRVSECCWKSAAVRCLEEAGKLAPPATTPGERAAQRRLPVGDGEAGTETQAMLDALDRIVDDLRRATR